MISLGEAMTAAISPTGPIAPWAFLPTAKPPGLDEEGLDVGRTLARAVIVFSS
ncbi:MAG: hypothetical protein IPK80_19770 [Nannocystis sp.]|nr:hypothetical protein [Nannocystis sp.]